MSAGVYQPTYATRYSRADFDLVAVGLVAINLVFLLFLIFSVLAAPRMRIREIPLELTGVSEGASLVRISTREVVVRIDAAGGLRAGGKVTSVAALEALLKRLSKENLETSVAIRADRRAPYSVVAKVLAATRSAGIRDASLLVVEAPKR